MSLKSVLISLFLLSFVSSCRLSPTDTTTRELRSINNSIAALVSLDHSASEAADKELYASYCTGTFVDAHTILTAYHCVEGTTTVQVAGFTNFSRSEDNLHFSGEKLNTYKVVAKDPAHDLALLRIVSTKNTQWHSVLPVALKSPRLLEKVYLIGHPMGYPWTTTEGTVAGVTRTGNPWDRKDVNTYLQISNHAGPGNSGGPVISKSGELVGVLVMGVPSAQIVLAVHLQEVQKFLEANL